MRVEDRLDKGTRNKLNILRGTKNKEKHKNPNNHQENLSERDIKDLMGINRATYKRCRGALRQR